MNATGVIAPQAVAAQALVAVDHTMKETEPLARAARDHLEIAALQRPGDISNGYTCLLLQ